MPITDIFPQTAEPIVPPTVDPFNQAGAIQLAGLQPSQYSTPELGDTYSLEGLLQKAATERAITQEEEPFGKNLSLDRAALMEKEAATTGTEYQMMAGKYFAQMPLISGKYSSELPVIAMMAEDEPVGPAQKQLDALQKRENQINFFPNVRQLGEDIIVNDVISVYDEARSLYGNKAPNILRGGWKNNQQKEIATKYNKALRATENLAALTNVVGKQALGLQTKKGRYTDPSADKFVSDFLGGLEEMRGRSSDEFFDYINDGSAIMTSNNNYNDALKNTLRGVAGVDSLVDAQIGTATQALANEGIPVAGQEIIRQLNIQSPAAAQYVENAAISLTNDGYTFGLDREKALDENRRRILNSYLPATQITYYAQPRETSIQRAAGAIAAKYSSEPLNKILAIWTGRGDVGQAGNGKILQLNSTGVMPVIDFQDLDGKQIDAIPMNVGQTKDGEKWIQVAKMNKPPESFGLPTNIEDLFASESDGSISEGDMKILSDLKTSKADAVRRYVNAKNDAISDFQNTPDEKKERFWIPLSNYNNSRYKGKTFHNLTDEWTAKFGKDSTPAKETPKAAAKKETPTTTGKRGVWDAKAGKIVYK